MATYSLRSSEYNSARSGEWQREIWGWDRGHDIRLVWVRAVDNCDDWVVGDDIEYTVIGSVNG